MRDVEILRLVGRLEGKVSNDMAVVLEVLAVLELRIRAHESVLPKEVLDQINKLHTEAVLEYKKKSAEIAIERLKKPILIH